MSALAARVGRLAPDRATALRAATVLNLEALAVIAYLAVAQVRITDPLVLVYPFVWINVGLWAILTTRPAPAGSRTRTAGIVAAAGYFGVLAVVGGLVGPGHAFHGHAHATGLRLSVASLPPGWAPAVFYGGSLVTVSVLPFKLVGYLALAYLVYATVLDAAGSAIAGVVGLFSCVSCAWPILGTVLASLLGGSSAVVAFATDQPYGASTLVFVSAVALLYWRPLAR